MFTGLIEEIGIIKALEQKENITTVQIKAHSILEGLKLGDSIAVNGVCLTVTTFDEQSFCVDVVQETLRVTSLGHLIVGCSVNLERSLVANARLGGHFVSGHVDCLGTLKVLNSVQGAYDLTIEYPSNFKDHFIKKGSVALDGISLTVAHCQDNTFTVTIIPHTLDHTNLCSKKVGDVLNIETDIIGKYTLNYLKNRGE